MNKTDREKRNAKILASTESAATLAAEYNITDDMIRKIWKAGREPKKYRERRTNGGVITDEIRAEMLRLHSEGRIPMLIADDLGYHANTVRKVIDAYTTKGGGKLTKGKPDMERMASGEPDEHIWDSGL